MRGSARKDMVFGPVRVYTVTVPAPGHPGQETCEELCGRGVDFTQPKEMPWGPCAIFVDPGGHSFGLRGRLTTP